MDTPMSSPGGTRQRVSRSRRPLMSSPHAKRPQVVSNLSSWLRSPSAHVASPSSEDATPMDGRRLNRSASFISKRPRLRTQSLRDKTRNAGMSGPSSPASPGLVSPLSQVDIAHPYISTTPTSVESPTSPTTPVIPGTQPRFSSSQPMGSPTLLRYGSFSYHGVVYSTPRFSPPDSRQRSSTWSSVDSASSQSFTALALPIGQKNTRWRAHESPTAAVPFDLVSYDGDDEEDEYNTLYEEYFPVVNPSPQRLQRPLRSPSGPRPMPNSPSAAHRGLGLGIAIIAPLLSSPSSARTGYDSNDEIDESEDAMEASPGPLLETRETSEQFEAPVDLSPRGRNRSNEARRRGLSISEYANLAAAAHDSEEDYSWEAQEYSNGKIDVAISPRPLTLSKGIARDEPLITPDPAPAVYPKSSDRGIHSPESVGPLAEPFELDHTQVMEVSTFESDSEDEAKVAVVGRRLNKLREALRNSVSLPRTPLS
ncbi:hypothetical protein NM688_g7935 [Phlebia brevispora]|uniref:Uncharacterized protein n=1 Tax=Phlebia brevispora TaxID=194682 RepID=A0ACC1RZG3_9APHY|nr:hypothetical protein NM688_g7935 [Phlebia brevispora]